LKTETAVGKNGPKAPPKTEESAPGASGKKLVIGKGIAMLLLSYERSNKIRRICPTNQLQRTG
jgi:hypothetical protein